MKTKERSAIHPFVREMIEEEIAARGWTEPALLISQLSRCGLSNAERLLQFNGRLTGIECMMIEKAFGVSDGFMRRFQDLCEQNYPQVKP